MPEDKGGWGRGVSKNHVKVKGGEVSKIKHGTFYIAPAPPPLPINNDQSLTSALKASVVGPKISQE